MYNLFLDESNLESITKTPQYNDVNAGHQPYENIKLITSI